MHPRHYLPVDQWAAGDAYSHSNLLPYQGYIMQDYSRDNQGCDQTGGVN